MLVLPFTSCVTWSISGDLSEFDCPICITRTKRVFLLALTGTTKRMEEEVTFSPMTPRSLMPISRPLNHFTCLHFLLRKTLPHGELDRSRYPIVQMATEAQRGHVLYPRSDIQQVVKDRVRTKVFLKVTQEKCIHLSQAWWWGPPRSTGVFACIFCCKFMVIELIECRYLQ